MESSRELLYKMNHAKRGIAVIFNHKNYDPRLEQKERKGTDIDRDSFKEALEILGFDVQSHDDFSLSQIETKLQELAKLDHSQNDCILVSIFTHGETKWLYARDQTYKLEWLWDHLDNDKCPTLAGKPKIFIVQVMPCSRSGQCPAVGQYKSRYNLFQRG